MSLPIWTPDALSLEARAARGTAWRLVEAQHVVSTMKLVDDLAEQELLEATLEETKPPIPPECRHLDFLLSTPFRYTHDHLGSRFRKAGVVQGVFYAAKVVETAVAEIAFHRLLFFAESPATPWPSNATEYSAFSIQYRTARALDLTKTPLDRDAAHWMQPTDYAACQALAEAARAVDVDVIRSWSVRDPAGGLNVSLLGCAAFARPVPIDRQSWRLMLGANGVWAICEAPDRRLQFNRTAFADDPRIATLDWDR